MPAKGVTFTRDMVTGELFEGRFNSIRMPGPIGNVLSVVPVDTDILIQDAIVSSTDPCVINFRIIMPISTDYKLQGVPGLRNIKVKVTFTPGVPRTRAGWYAVKAFSQNQPYGEVIISCDGRIMMLTVLPTGGEKVVIISKDYGATWERVILTSGPGLERDTPVRHGAVGGNVIVANYYDANVTDEWRTLVSNDGGLTWIVIVPLNEIEFTAMSASKDGRYILGVEDSSGDTYFSNDFGATFSNLSAVIVPSSFFRSIISETGRFMLVCAFGDQPWMSSDYGATWSQPGVMPPQAGSAREISMNLDGSCVMVTDGSYDTNVYSLDHGATWVLLPDITGLFGQNPAGPAGSQVGIEHIVVDKKKVFTLFGWAYWGETFESKNLGVSWVNKPELTMEYPFNLQVSGFAVPLAWDANFYKLFVNLG